MRLNLLLVIFVLQMICALNFADAGGKHERSHQYVKKLNHLRKEQFIHEMKKPATNIDPPGKLNFTASDALLCKLNLSDPPCKSNSLVI